MKNRKLLFTIAIATGIIIILGSIFLFHQNNIKTITSLYNNDANKINKIEIMSGSNPNRLTVDNKKVISDITNYLSKLKFTKIHSEPSTGWDYRFFIYESNKKKLEIEFVSENLCIFNNNGVKYTIEKSTDVTAKSLYNEALKSAK
jgi:hypothetical protein